MSVNMRTIRLHYMDWTMACGNVSQN